MDERLKQSLYERTDAIQLSSPSSISSANAFSMNNNFRYPIVKTKSPTGSICNEFELNKHLNINAYFTNKNAVNLTDTSSNNSELNDEVRVSDSIANEENSSNIKKLSIFENSKPQEEKIILNNYYLNNRSGNNTSSNDSTLIRDESLIAEETETTKKEFVTSTTTRIFKTILKNSKNNMLDDTSKELDTTISSISSSRKTTGPVSIRIDHQIDQLPKHMFNNKNSNIHCYRPSCHCRRYSDVIFYNTPAKLSSGEISLTKPDRPRRVSNLKKTKSKLKNKPHDKVKFSEIELRHLIDNYDRESLPILKPIHICNKQEPKLHRPLSTPPEIPILLSGNYYLSL